MTAPKVALRTQVLCFAVLLAVALLMRVRWIGNPMPQTDEQFYLLVADRIWRGELPYVDIWDRKPLGLFLLFALVRPFSSDGIIAYQVAALGFAVGTALTITRIGLRLGALPAALSAAVVYLLAIQMLGGEGGQSPIFYNLFMALAALFVIKAQEDSDRHLWLHGAAAMMLVGIAIQIKYPAFVEGIVFGCYLLWLQWGRRRRLVPLLGFAGVMVGLALLPTVLAFGFYALRGNGWAFIQANFLSIFQTVDPGNGEGLAHLGVALTLLAPTLVVSALGATALVTRRPRSQLAPFMILWLVFAAVGFSLIGRFYIHYALPMLVPLSLLTVPLFSSPLAAGLAIGMYLFFTLDWFVFSAGAERARRDTYIAKLVTIMRPYTLDGCLYLRDGPPIVYLLTRSCLPSPYVFPDHLSKVTEAKAASATENMARLLAGHPSAIAISDRITDTPDNPITLAMLRRSLATDYHLLDVVPEGIGHANQSIYVRNDLH